MSQPIDVAYVELRARGEREAARDVRDSLDDIQRDVERTSQDIERSFADASKSIGTSLDAVGQGVEDTADDISTSLTDAAKKSAEGFDKLTAAAVRTRAEMEEEFEAAGFQLVSNFDTVTKQFTQRWVKIGDDAEDAFDRVRDTVDESDRTFSRFRDRISGLFDGPRRDSDNLAASLGGTLKEGIDRVTAAISQAGTQFTQFATSGDTLTQVLRGLLIGSLVPALVAVGAAALEATSVIALLPGLVGGTAAAGGTLILAFQGIGEAIEALGTGELEEIEEALEGLSASARVFVREIDRLREPFAELQRAVQQAFFAEITGDITLLARVALPVLREGLVGVSAALGDAAEQFIAFLRNRATLDVFAGIFDTVERAINRLTPSIIGLFEALVGSTETSLPFLDRMVDAVGSLVDRFAEFITSVTESGDLESFLEGAFQTFSDLGDLLVSVGRLLGALFGDSADEGRTFLQTITDIVDKLTEFFESAEGQQAVQDSINTMLLLGQALVAITGVLVSGAQAFQRFIEDVKTLDETVSAAGTSVGEFFTSLNDRLTAVGVSLTGFGVQVLGFFQALPGQLLAVVQAVPAMLANVFTQAFDLVTFAIGFGIGLVVRTMATLPALILGAIISMVDTVASVFTSAFNSAVNLARRLVDSVTSFLSTLPERVRSVIANLPGTVAGVFNSARTSAVDRATSLVDRVTSILRSLPGRAASALASFDDRVHAALRAAVGGAVDIGRDIMNGVVRGIEAGVGAAISAARRAARNILAGMQAALDIRSPSRVFADEVGRPIPAGVSVGIREGEPDLQRTLNSVAGGLVPGVTNVGGDSAQSLVFGPGSVQVTVMGSATESEARTVGSAVGAGIIDAVTRRRVQLRVRTI